MEGYIPRAQRVSYTCIGTIPAFAQYNERHFNGNYTDEQALAAIWLHKATGELAACVCMQESIGRLWGLRIRRQLLVNPLALKLTIAHAHTRATTKTGDTAYLDKAEALWLECCAPEKGGEAPTRILSWMDMHQGACARSVTIAVVCMVIRVKLQPPDVSHQQTHIHEYTHTRAQPSTSSYTS